MKVLSPGDIRCPSTGKASWGSEDLALSAVQSAWLAPDWRNDHGRMPHRVYLCPDCGLYHMTSAPQRDERTA